jgi:putative flippase GtrA
MRLHHQFLRFAAVGASGTAVQYLSLWTGVALLHRPAALASAIGYMLGSVVNYILNYLFTFQSNNSHFEAAPKYFAVLGVGFCINTGLMTLLVHHWGWNYWIAQFMTTGIGLCWNFSGSRLWAFKPGNSQ